MRPGSTIAEEDCDRDTIHTPSAKTTTAHRGTANAGRRDDEAEEESSGDPRSRKPVPCLRSEAWHSMEQDDEVGREVDVLSFLKELSRPATTRCGGGLDRPPTMLQTTRGSVKDWCAGEWWLDAPGSDIIQTSPPPFRYTIPVHQRLDCSLCMPVRVGSPASSRPSVAAMGGQSNEAGSARSQTVTSRR
ncbi:hypothetical protein C8F01DRAFT_799530 [Mycena amicta]|nr:hypothetical protein C8F01DRAFT_799530 [Mycena amicta]